MLLEQICKLKKLAKNWPASTLRFFWAYFQLALLWSGGWSYSWKIEAIKSVSEHLFQFHFTWKELIFAGSKSAPKCNWRYGEWGWSEDWF